ncbi:MAG: TRAP transporter small permease [Gammaproteobacteria bacterium]|nr:TRAP transporter small permease [Gammaproteobacteria bacterium]MBU1444013.1 TRAP transporter small permease [Gammaproteobacteria bacterium]MBU2288445.1 TRAP transporter small permease [Gammaproteobacteria bacterium]MBU2408949.1 TRAP transporter small permease [Gammaproteobacteria bacterium]
MRKALDTLYAAALFAAGVFLVGIFLTMVFESILRKFGSYIPGASELIGWFLAAAGFLALPATFKRGDMVRVGILVDVLPPVIRKPLLLVCVAVALVFTTYMVWAVGVYLFDGWRSEELTQGMLEVAVWVPQSSFLVGAALLLVAVVDECVNLLATPAAALRAERVKNIDDAASH